jgi:hypothetical protein
MEFGEIKDSTQATLFANAHILRNSRRQSLDFRRPQAISRTGRIPDGQRLTNAHSKLWQNHEAAIALVFMAYNFVTIHSTLKTTPAV